MWNKLSRMAQQLDIKLFGSGKMGKAVGAVATQRGHLLVDQVSPTPNLVCIDFSHPEAVCGHIREAAEKGIDIVVGTTGWEKRRAEVEEIVADADIGFLYSPNFSVGVFLFRKVAAYTAQLMRDYPQYTVSLEETHHTEKVDAPSGTALRLSQDLGGEVPITSHREGANPGVHVIDFTAPEDTITLSHQAHGREGFALGAVLAAEWLKGKKGIFTMEDIL